ncbi:MAG TPA: hypothetical protein VLE91_04120 [Candidatus Saccharimonadales bacterium]|nr:hypothetical protein [Candidatus Saccharimonadales bacterium]
MSKSAKDANSHFLLTVLSSSLIIIFFVLALFKLDAPTVVAQNKDSFVQNVPEIVDILKNRANPDEQIRATRALALRVGPDEALELLNDSAIPHTGEGHLVIHQVGYVAWERYGKDALLHCKDYFLYACYHGAIIEAANQGQGFSVIADMVSKCGDSGARYFQCIHAAGHGILAIWNYDVPSALKTCDELFDQYSEYPNSNIVSNCHNGVFMENIYGLHDWGRDNPNPVRKWLSSDPYFPCNAMAQRYQEGCWLNQASRMYQIFNGDFSKVAKACDALRPDYASWCFDNLGRQIHPNTIGQPQKVYEMCQVVGDKWYGFCVSTNAKAYMVMGDGKTSIAVCNGAQDAKKQDCFASITSLVNIFVDSNQRVNMCNLMEQTYAKDCLSQVQI